MQYFIHLVLVISIPAIFGDLPIGLKWVPTGSNEPSVTEKVKIRIDTGLDQRIKSGETVLVSYNRIANEISFNIGRSVLEMIRLFDVDIGLLKPLLNSINVFHKIFEEAVKKIEFWVHNLLGSETIANSTIIEKSHNLSTLDSLVKEMSSIETHIFQIFSIYGKVVSTDKDASASHLRAKIIETRGSIFGEIDEFYRNMLQQIPLNHPSLFRQEYLKEVRNVLVRAIDEVTQERKTKYLVLEMFEALDNARNFEQEQPPN